MLELLTLAALEFLVRQCSRNRFNSASDRFWFLAELLRAASRCRYGLPPDDRCFFVLIDDDGADGAGARRIGARGFGRGDEECCGSEGMTDLRFFG